MGEIRHFLLLRLLKPYRLSISGLSVSEAIKPTEVTVTLSFSKKYAMHIAPKKIVASFVVCNCYKSDS